MDYNLSRTALYRLPRPPPPATVRLLCSDFCQLTDSQLLTTGRAVETDRSVLYCSVLYYSAVCSAGTRDLVRLTRLLAECSDQAGELQAVMQVLVHSTTSTCIMCITGVPQFAAQHRLHPETAAGL